MSTVREMHVGSRVRSLVLWELLVLSEVLRCETDDDLIEWVPYRFSSLRSRRGVDSEDSSNGLIVFWD